MKLFDLFVSNTLRVRRETEAVLANHSHPHTEYFLLTGFATVLAVLGLTLNNAAVVIGAMIVAPLVTPVFGLALSLILLHLKDMVASLVMLIAGSALSILLAMLMTLVVVFLQQQSIVITDEILARTKPDLLYFFVAVVSGMIGAYAYAKKSVSERIAGVAISVAILPPLAVVGIQLALTNWNAAAQSMWLYMFNLLGICFGSILIFLAMGFGKEIDKA